MRLIAQFGTNQLTETEPQKPQTTKNIYSTRARQKELSLETYTSPATEFSNMLCEICGSGFCGPGPLFISTAAFVQLRREMCWHLDHRGRIGLAICAGCRRFFRAGQEVLELADGNAV
jgi:hypothetical protein